MVPVYRAGKQLIKVRVFMLVSLAVLGLCMWWGHELFWTHGVNPAEGGVLAPWPERLAWAGLVVSLGFALAGGMAVYGRHYAAAIAFDAENRQIHLTTVGFFRGIRHVISASGFGRGQTQHVLDQVSRAVASMSILVGSPTPTVNAPWKSVRIAGWRWSLIVDCQGEILHPGLMKALVGGL